MAAKRVAIHVSTATAKAVHAYAEKRGTPVGETADALITTALGRLAALAAYAAKQKKPKPKRAKK
jgi:hypothetical protein